MTAHQYKLLRNVDPPLGAKRRVLENVEAELQQPPRRSRRWLLAPAAAVAVVFAMWWLNNAAMSPGLVDRSATPAPAAIANTPPQPVAKPIPAKPSPTVQPTLELAADDRMSVSLAKAKLVVSGPAKLLVKNDRIRLSKGTARVDGNAVIEAPQCRCEIAGKAKVSVTAGKVQVSVFAGSAKVFPGSPDCSVTRVPLTPLPAPKHVTPKPPTSQQTKGRPTSSPATTATPPEPSADSDAGKPRTADATTPANGSNASKPRAADATTPLRRQVVEFRRAKALAKRDDRAAISAWRSLLATWPDSPLRQEAESSLIEALSRTGQWALVGIRARLFLRRYPSSTYAAKVRALLNKAAAK